MLLRNIQRSRVPADVLNDSIQVLRISDNLVVAFLFPKLILKAQCHIQMPGSDPLHLSEQIFKLITIKGANDCMTMIRHDDGARELISRSIEVLQALIQVVDPVLFTKVAFSVSFIKPRFRPTHNFASI